MPRGRAPHNRPTTSTSKFKDGQKSENIVTGRVDIGWERLSVLCIGRKRANPAKFDRHLCQFQVEAGWKLTLDAPQEARLLLKVFPSFLLSCYPPGLDRPSTSTRTYSLVTWKKSDQIKTKVGASQNWHKVGTGRRALLKIVFFAILDWPIWRARWKNCTHIQNTSWKSSKCFHMILDIKKMES